MWVSRGSDLWDDYDYEYDSLITSTAYLLALCQALLHSSQGLSNKDQWDNGRDLRRMVDIPLGLFQLCQFGSLHLRD